MKKYIFLLITVSLYSLSACMDVLDTPPANNPSEDILWQSKADFDLALAGCYASMQTETLTWQSLSYDSMTDNSYTGETSSYGFKVGAIQQGKITADMEGLVPTLYKEAYEVIAGCNIFLDKLEEYNGGDISDTYRKQLIGEVTFLRSYAYYMLYLHYGEVPIVTETTTIENQYRPKNTLQQVYEHLYDDLTLCINYLPDLTYSESGGHVTKGAARGLLARLLMFNAYGDNGTVTNSSLVQEAYNLLDQIKGYSLNERYEYNFRTDEQETSPEIIFSVKYYGTNYTRLDYIYGQYMNVIIVDDLANEYEDGDLRKDVTMWHWNAGPYTWSGGDAITLPVSTIGWALIKYITPVYTQGDLWTNSTRSEQDIVLLRWGELILLKAEAANELNNQQEAVSLVNEVRKRAGLDPISSSSQSELREIIRKERRVETPVEGIRIYDMKRWRLMDKINGLILDSTLQNYKPVWTEKFFYLPLPHGEIEKAGGILVQNPSYL